MLVEILASVTHNPFLITLSIIGWMFMMIRLYKWAYNSNLTTYKNIN